MFSALQQELHEVKGQEKATKEELITCKELSQRLQEQIQVQLCAVFVNMSLINETPLNPIFLIIKEIILSDCVILFLKGARNDNCSVEGSGAQGECSLLDLVIFYTLLLY